MHLYRNIRARDHLEIFLVAAVTSLLLVRFYLYITGFPQLGGGNFHIAHMLWGGLLMLAGMIIALSFIGFKAQRSAALISGLGFGVFIDEIGKFITSDNDYFFRPAVGIIYAIFVVLYLAVNFITKNKKLQSREYQLNALVELEEALSRDMDKNEKARTLAILSQADQKDRITVDLQKLLKRIETIPQPAKGRFARFFEHLDELYLEFWRKSNSNNLIRAFFVAGALLIFLGVLATLALNVDDVIDLAHGSLEYGSWLLIGEFTSALIASLLAIKGAIVLRHSRFKALELFRSATLINLLLTEFFTFSRIEFQALPGFAFNLVLMVLISYVIEQEKKLGHIV